MAGEVAHGTDKIGANKMYKTIQYKVWRVDNMIEDVPLPTQKLVS